MNILLKCMLKLCTTKSLFKSSSFVPRTGYFDRLWRQTRSWQYRSNDDSNCCFVFRERTQRRRTKLPGTARRRQRRVFVSFETRQRLVAPDPHVARLRDQRSRGRRHIRSRVDDSVRRADLGVERTFDHADTALTTELNREY